MIEILNITNGNGTDNQRLNGLVNVKNKALLKELLDVSVYDLMALGEGYLVEKANNILIEFVFPWRAAHIKKFLEEEYMQGYLDGKGRCHLPLVEMLGAFNEVTKMHVMIGGDEILTPVLKRIFESHDIVCHYALTTTGESNYFEPNGDVKVEEDVIFCGYWPPLEKI